VVLSGTQWEIPLANLSKFTQRNLTQLGGDGISRIRKSTLVYFTLKEIAQLRPIRGKLAQLQGY